MAYLPGTRRPKVRREGTEGHLVNERSDARSRRLTASPGELLQFIADGSATTRTALADLTGLARSTVSQRLEPLLQAGFVHETDAGVSTGGRPPVVLAFNRTAGVVLAADVGVTHVRVGVADLAGELLAERFESLEIAAGPEVVLPAVQRHFDALLEEIGHGPERVRGVGVGLPGPVEFARGVAVSPPIMPGWHEYPVTDGFRERYDAPVLVDNDVNVMALGEYERQWAHRVDDLLFVKVGSGIGAGVIMGGRIHRGAQGAAGDIGHIRLAGADDAVCACSNVGCIEAVAGGAALAAQLQEQGHTARTASDVVDLVKAGNREAMGLVRGAGRDLGIVLAGIVNLLNPAVIVLGGRLAAVDEPLLAGVRESLYSRSLPLATRSLQIVRSQLGEEAGVTGAVELVLDHILTPEAVDAQLRTRADAPAVSAS
jgi:predicted NBD/HSP70 family sugar kinase